MSGLVKLVYIVLWGKEQKYFPFIYTKTVYSSASCVWFGASVILAPDSVSNCPRLKQKYPLVMRDPCLYSEIAKVLGQSTFRLQSRRFLQELFLDVDFLPLFDVPRRIVGIPVCTGACATIPAVQAT